MTRPRYIDIHAHVHFPEFDADRAQAIDRALSQGVWMINVGTDAKTSAQAVELAGTYARGVFAAVGLHPTHAVEEVFDMAVYRALARQKGVVAIGECGLDYFRSEKDSAVAGQVTAFKGQIELALELDLPLILHIRAKQNDDAYRDTLNILKAYKTTHGDRLRGDVHFFAGSVEVAKEFLALGFYLSFTGVVTFAREYEKLVLATPDDRIMAETDCPYVAPAPMRGKRNEPAFVAHIADAIARIKGGEADVMREKLVENAMRLFRL